MSTAQVRWVLVLDGGPGVDPSAVAALLAIATGAVHFSEDEGSTRLAADVAHSLDATGRAIVEMPLPPSGSLEDASSAFDAVLAARRDVQLLTVRLAGSRDSTGAANTAAVVSIATGGLTAEQVVAVLNPVLSGPRQPDELAKHVARRLSVLSLGGLPVAGHAVTELITDHLQRDSTDTALLDRWWRSTVIDENTGQPVLVPETYEWIDRFDRFDRASSGTRWPVSHAGLLHTYGYTLSTAWTPYGWKSDRYIDGTLATLLGMDADDLTPWAADGTVLSNLTRALDALVAGAQSHHLIEERGRLVDLGEGAVDGTLRTRIYERTSARDGHLLIYTIEFAGTGIERYVTSFPMGGAGVEALLADSQARSRFNVAATLSAGSRTVRMR